MFARIWSALMAGVTMLGLATVAGADEVWTSEFGDVVYLEDVDGSVDRSAVLTFTTLSGTPAELVVRGLAGNVDMRAVHEGYWIGTGEPVCDTMMSRPGGTPSAEWGPALVAFDKASYPTSFTVVLGWCDDAYVTSFRALTTAE